MAESDEPPAVPFAAVAPGAPIVDGETVRALVARQEAEIGRLTAQLIRVERTALEMEAEVRAHPAYGMLDVAERRRLESPPSDDESANSAGSGVTASTAGDRRPRTTVDARSRRSTMRAAPALAAKQSQDGESTERSRVGSLLTSHWVWKVGVALTAVAVLLIKFG